MNRKHLPASLLMMSVLLFLMSAAAEAKEPVMAPRIEAPTLNGDMQMVPEKGKDHFAFWTTWCPSCKMELPEFEQIVKENQSDVDILTVNLLGAEQSKHAVAQFVKDRRFTFPIILDEHGEMMKKYQIITIPTTF